MTKSVSILREHLRKPGKKFIHGSVQFNEGRLVFILRALTPERRQFAKMLMGDIIATLEADGYKIHNKSK